MKNISYSSLKLSKDCPACFWWYVKHGIDRKCPWSSNLPNVIEDQILKRFEKYRIVGKLPPELDVPELRDFKLINSELHKKWKDIFSGEPNYKDLTANPDDVLTNGKKLIVLDIKTIGKFPERCTKEAMLKDIKEFDYKSQLEFYSYILRKCGYPTEDFGYILFKFIGNGDEDGKFKLGHELIKVELDINGIEKIIDKARKVLKRKNPPKGRCVFCSSHKQRYKDYLKEQKKQEELINEIIKI